MFRAWNSTGPVCVDANLRVGENGTVQPVTFRGTRWQAVNDVVRRKYILNAHRVLLTRARQGVVIFVPSGDSRDPTRNPLWYAGLYRYLLDCGVEPL
jgi:hypothetical protein